MRVGLLWAEDEARGTGGKSLTGGDDLNFQFMVAEGGSGGKGNKFADKVPPSDDGSALVSKTGEGEGRLGCVAILKCKVQLGGGFGELGRNLDGDFVRFTAEHDGGFDEP